MRLNRSDTNLLELVRLVPIGLEWFHSPRARFNKVGRDERHLNSFGGQIHNLSMAAFSFDTGRDNLGDVNLLLFFHCLSG